MEMNNNPSPGNKLGGLTTILEKSLGAAAKGGSTHAQRRLSLCRSGHREGLRLHGHARLRSGRGHRPGRRRRQHPRFTTGRGSAYGCKPTPSIKLATNTPMYERMVDDMDINCGDMLDGVSAAGQGRGNLQRDPRGRVRQEDQVRRTRLRRQRIRALADRRHHVAGRPQGLHALAVAANLRQFSLPDHEPDRALTQISLASLLPAIVAGIPEAASLVEVRSGKRRSRNEIWQAVCSRAAAIVQSGVARGDTVVVGQPEGARFILDVFAAWTAGASPSRSIPN